MCPKWNKWIRLENVASSSTNTSTLQLHYLVILIIYQTHLLFAPFCHFWRRKHKTFLSNSLNSLCLCYFFPSAPFNLPENVPWIQISKQGQTKTLRKACRRRWHTWFCFNWNWLFYPFLKMLKTYFHAKKFEEALVLNLLRLMIDQILVWCHEIIRNVWMKNWFFLWNCNAFVEQRDFSSCSP